MRFVHLFFSSSSISIDLDSLPLKVCVRGLSICTSAAVSSLQRWWWWWEGDGGAEGVHQSAVCSEASASPALTLSRADVVFDNVMCLACSYDFFFSLTCRR